MSIYRRCREGWICDFRLSGSANVATNWLWDVLLTGYQTHPAAIRNGHDAGPGWSSARSAALTRSPPTPVQAAKDQQTIVPGQDVAASWSQPP